MKIVIMFLSLIFSAGSISCTCIGVNSVKEEINGSDIVVIGTVVSKSYEKFVDSTLASYEKDISLFKYSLAVEKKYKGRITKDTISIYTGPSGGSCGNNFEIGEKYIIYGFKKTYYQRSIKILPKGKNIFWTHKCTRTTRYFEEEEKQIEKYRSKK